MAKPPSSDITQALIAVTAGDEEALNQLRNMAARELGNERVGHTLTVMA